ncbi:MAG: HAMP domain-containing histidine kinase, partial [Clostridia bacterium]|nr:HAMP domain-containing histidine kinase [Clostridia bacterium]
MKKTLFREMFIYNVLLVILSMALTAIVLYTQLGAYFKASIYKTLDSRAEQVSKMSGYLIDAGGGMSQAVGLREVMALIGHDEGQAFIITDASGNIVVHVGFADKHLQKYRIEKNEILDSIEGETVAREGDLGGALSNRFLYVTTPLRTRLGIEGTVIACSTVPYIQNMQLGVMRMFFFAVTFVIVLTLLVAAWFSQRIAKPVREMTTVARRIASGDFTQRVSHDAEGELGILAASFNQMTVALGEMDEVQSSFISDVSHELRTPMTIISGFVEGVLDGTIPATEHKKYLEIVLSEIKRLNRLVNDLLEMSRLNSGKIEYKMVPFDITESMRKAIVAFEQGISEKKIEISVDFDSDCMSVMGNSDSVYR